MNAGVNRSCVNRAASICVALVVGVCGLFGAVTPGNAAKSSTEAYLDRLHGQGKERVIVRFKDDAKVDTSLVGKHGGKLIRSFTTIKGLVCEIPQGKLAALQKEGAVKHAFPDALVRIEPIREVPAEDSEPEKKEDGISMKSYTGPVTVRWNNLEAGMNTKAAWDNYGLDGSGVKIAFLDTGVNYNLTNLYDSYLGGTDYVEDDGDPLTTNANEYHGTVVVSVAVGRGVDGGKVVGVAYRAGFYAVKVIDSTAVGFVSDVMSGIEWASTEPHKADIISMSLTSYNLLPGTRAAYEQVCDNAYNAGIVLVAGSGNSGYTYSGDPAAFTNVISAGGHAEDQTIYDYNGSSSNGDVDIIAPGAHVYSVDPANAGWWLWGTSVATPHASALIALQLQGARQYNIQPNNGYLWEVMKHSAKDMPLITDPNYKGNGKIWAAETNPPPADPKDGSIDAMVKRWPLAFGLSYSNAAYYSGGQPVYGLGSNLSYGITLTNNTGTAGNYTNEIENLDDTTTQAYYQAHAETNLPGSTVEAFPRAYVPPAAMAPDTVLGLADSYSIPPEVYPGTNRLMLELGFEFASDANNRLIQVRYPYAGLWLAVSSSSNQPPVAAGLSVVAGKGTNAVSFVLPASDPDPGDAIAAVIVSGPTNGLVTVTEGTNGVYRAWTNAPLEDGFEYYVQDGGGLVSSTNLVTITLTNAPPVAFGQAVTNLAETASGITLAGTDADGDGLAYQVASAPLHGALTGSGSNRVYTASNNWYGADGFNFVVNDGWTDSAPANVALTILPVSRAPYFTSVSNDGANVTLYGMVQPYRLLSVQSRLNLPWESWTNERSEQLPYETNFLVSWNASFLKRTNISEESNECVIFRLESRAQ